jgi:hypothetical protein
MANFDKCVLVDVSLDGNHGTCRNGNHTPVIIFRQNGPAATFQLEDVPNIVPLLSARFKNDADQAETGAKYFDAELLPGGVGSTDKANCPTN